jgi:methyl-accepting chemotaxis protein
MKINDLNITTKLTYAFATVVTCFVLVSGVVWLNVDALKQASGWDAHTSQVVYNIDAAKNAMVDRETGVRGFLLGGDKKFLEPFNNGNANFDKAVEQLSQLTADNPTQQERIQRLKAAAQGWVDEIANKEISLRSAPATAQEGVSIETSGAGKTRMDAIRVILGDMRRMETDLAVTRAAKTDATVMSTKIALALGTLLAILMVVIMVKVINAKPGDSLAVDAVILEFA